MECNDVTPVSVSGPGMDGWWVEMRPGAFSLCAPADRPFERCEAGYRVGAAEAEPMRVALVAASRWFRSVWHLDPEAGYAFGTDRGVRVRAVGEFVELRCPALASGPARARVLEFNYVELPALRAAIARRARPRRRASRLEPKEHDDATEIDLHHRPGPSPGDGDAAAG